MRIDEICDDKIDIDEAGLVWARKGSNVTKKFRCAAGTRKGRIVSDPSQCNAPVDMKKKLSLKKTKSKLGNRMVRKAKKTKRVNPASRRLGRLNKRK